MDNFDYKEYLNNNPLREFMDSSTDNVKKAADMIIAALNIIDDPTKYELNQESLDEKSFDLDVITPEGQHLETAGGSYLLQDNGDIVNAAIGNKLYGNLDDTIEDIVKKINMAIGNISEGEMPPDEATIKIEGWADDGISDGEYEIVGGGKKHSPDYDTEIYTLKNTESGETIEVTADFIESKGWWEGKGLNFNPKVEEIEETKKPKNNKMEKSELKEQIRSILREINGILPESYFSPEEDINLEDENEFSNEEDDEIWTDPAGGTHYGNEDDPAAMYVEEADKTKEKETDTEELPAEEEPQDPDYVNPDEESDFSTNTLSDSDIKQIQTNLEDALASAKELGDKKLIDQIGNTITFFTRTHVVKREPEEASGAGLIPESKRFQKLAGIITENK